MNEKEILKNHIEKYLHLKGINTNKNFNCLNPAHDDKDPSMSYNKETKQAHCFGCNESYDIFDLIGIDYNLKEFKDQLQKAKEIFNMQDSGNIPKVKEVTREVEELTDYTAYFKSCKRNLVNTGYLKTRGISKKVADKFNIGYDNSCKLLPSGKALIIPTSKYTYVARNIDPKADKKDKWRNTKGAKSNIFNINVLKENKPVFIVEGQIDTLSFEEIGYNAIGLGGIGNIQKLLDKVKECNFKNIFLIALDNDNTGQEQSLKYKELLDKNKIKNRIVNVYKNFKDANEILVEDKETFKKLSQEAVDYELIEYLKKSNLNYSKDFLVRIQDRRPVIKTGFKRLDEILGGGVYEGLYILGAMSSLGKTTYVLQIADQIAKDEDIDVLIISLEMSRDELIAKSYSRNTKIIQLQKNLSEKLPKTTRGIIAAERYEHYSNDEKNLIMEANELYQEYANRIFVFEGIGNISVIEIREIVEKHVRITGRIPIVVIDYIQMLYPSDPRATDKTNMDKSMTDLKRLSRDYQTAVIGISSLNRTNYNKEIAMESFKESGGIEYTADVLLGLQLEYLEAGETTDDKMKQPKRAIELKILKNRSEAVGEKIPLTFHTLFNYFTEEY